MAQQQQQQQQQQQYRDPPPYPGHSKQVYNNQPGFRQSFSGSETSTDVSLSSTENLATWQRQEPQGEETQAPMYQHLDDGGYSILARLGMPPGAIDSKRPSDEQTTSESTPSYSSMCSQWQSIYSTSSSREELMNYSSSGGGVGQSLNVPRQQQQQTLGLPPPQSGHYARSLPLTYHHPHPYVNQHWTPGDCVPHIRTLPPPPEYPGSDSSGLEAGKSEVRRSYETIGGKVELTRSQPDLTGLSDAVASQRMLPKGNVVLGCHAGSEPTFSGLRTGSSTCGSQDRLEQVMDIVAEENRKLKAELAVCYKKVSKLQKFEMEIQKVHEAHESLIKSSQKRERLETAIKNKLEEEVKKLRAQNEDLQGQLKQALSAAVTSKKRESEGQMEKLQKALSSLPFEQESSKSEDQGVSSGSNAPKEEAKSVIALKQILNDKETKILQLETEIVRWEQRYMDLDTVQHIDSNTGPQQAHLAALEKSSVETEKLIDEAKVEKLRHMEEVYRANRRVAELEARVKWLQTQLTEKEAVVRVYQRAPPSLPRSSSVHAICCSPHHSPRPSLVATTAYTRPPQNTNTGSYCDFVNVRHIKTGSTSALETGRKMSLDDTLTDSDTVAKAEQKEEEVQLWQV